jgi:hypothetical protein
VGPLLLKPIPENVTVRVDLAAGLPRVRVAPHRLTQAMLNLVVNACEAMPSGGHLRIWARPGADGRTLHVGVSDTGVGMSEEVRHRAFDPFFTTKRRRLSTGLGLSLVHGVATSSRGTVEIDSAPGRGTSVVMKFPAALDDDIARGLGRATVSLSDGRQAAWWSGLLRSEGYAVTRESDTDPADGRLWVVDPTPQAYRRARRFLAADPQHRVIVFGTADPRWARLPAIMVEDDVNLDAIREAVARVRPVRGTQGETGK